MFVEVSPTAQSCKLCAGDVTSFVYITSIFWSQIRMSTDTPGYVSCSFRLPAAAQQPIQTPCVVDLLYGLPESGVHCTPTRHNQTHKLKGQKCHLPEVLYANTVFDVRIFMGPTYNTMQDLWFNTYTECLYACIKWSPSPNLAPIDPPTPGL